MNKVYIISSIVLLTVIGFTACNESQKDSIEPEFYAITRVIDGDNIEVMIKGKKEKVRLIGIDAPEKRRGNKSYNTAKFYNINADTLLNWGKNAAKFLNHIAPPGSAVRLEFDKDSTDQYQRLLAYVFLEDGRMINKIIAENGYCFTVFYSPNYKYRSLLETAEATAKEKELGIWSVRAEFREKK